ncbi:MAG: type II secretion system protein GspC [Pseudomonadota bacterium]
MAASLKIDRFSAIAPADLAGRASAVLPKWITLALVVLIGWQIANILFAFFDSSSPADEALAPRSSAATVERADAPAYNTAAIRSGLLFGDLDPAKVDPQPVRTEVVDKTTLNLELKGTIAADDPDFARAIIADAQRKEKVYAVKDTIAQGVTLHAVERLRVILNQSGRLTSLDLPQEFKGKASTTRRVSRPTRVSNSRSRSTQSVQQALTENVASLTDIIRPQPYFSGGQQKGYRVYPGKDRKQFAALGLRPGDLVTEINGTPMTDPRQGMQVFRSLGDATSVSVTIERNGQPQQLTLSTSQLDPNNQ